MDIEKMSNLMVAICGSICFSSMWACLSLTQVVGEELWACVLMGIGIGPCAYLGIIFMVELLWRIREGA